MAVGQLCDGRINPTHSNWKQQTCKTPSSANTIDGINNRKE